VLVEADDLNDPAADAVRSILDGHVILSRNLASRGHYPAIDVLESVSRLMPDITTPEHQEAAQRLRAALANYREAEDLISLGAYVAGSSPKVDEAIALYDQIIAFLRQGINERSSLAETLAGLEGAVRLPVAVPDQGGAEKRQSVRQVEGLS